VIIHEVEQNTPEWFALRLGIPTASVFSKLLTSKGEPSKSADDYAAGLAADLRAGEETEKWEGNQWTERGHEIEIAARAWYSLEYDADIRQVGFVTDDNLRYGCSPDGMLGDDGLIEIKSLMGKNHVKAVAYFSKYKKPPPEYIAQVQGQMLVCERDWCDLVFHHPLVRPTLVIRIKSDAGFQSRLLAQIERVITLRDEYLETLQKYD